MERFSHGILWCFFVRTDQYGFSFLLNYVSKPRTPPKAASVGAYLSHGAVVIISVPVDANEEVPLPPQIEGYDFSVFQVVL